MCIYPYRIVRFIKSIGIVASTCGYNKAIRRAMFIIVHRLFTNDKERCIAVKSGYKMWLLPNDTGISSELKVFKVHEPLTTKMLFNYIQSGWIVIDVGSNIGYYALLESRLVGKKGKVIAIEPVPQNFEFLVRNVELNQAANIFCLNYAISNKIGHIKMIVPSYSNWCKIFTGQIDELLKNEKYRMIEVPVITIDKLVRSLKLRTVDLIRIDVEGHEKAVIEGAKNTIKRHHPDVLVEIHTKYLGKKGTKDFLDFLKNEGYHIEWGIIRDLDFQGVGNEKDVRQYSFKDILVRASDNMMIYMRSVLHMFASKKKKCKINNVARKIDF